MKECTFDVWKSRAQISTTSGDEVHVSSSGSLSAVRSTTDCGDLGFGLKDLGILIEGDVIPSTLALRSGINNRVALVRV